MAVRARPVTIQNPITFFARDRELAEFAQAGDIIGIPITAPCASATRSARKATSPSPAFPTLRPRSCAASASRSDEDQADAQGPQDLAEEGVIRVFRPAIGSNWIVGVVGALQLEVLATRMESEYGVKLDFEASPYEVARWVTSNDPAEVKRLMTTHRSVMAEDQDDDPVLLIRNPWELGRFEQDWPMVRFGTVKERS
jgi:peptide chain release factor 3